MEWIFIAFLIVSMLHMGEEYLYPGGFMDVMKRVMPGFAPLVTVPMAVTINTLQLLACLAAIAMGNRILVFSMSVAALLFINGFDAHPGVRQDKGVCAGVVTVVLLYIPLSSFAYYHTVSSGQLTLRGAGFTAVLGLGFQVVPISYLLLANAIRQASAGRERRNRRLRSPAMPLVDCGFPVRPLGRSSLPPARRSSSPGR